MAVSIIRLQNEDAHTFAELNNLFADVFEDTQSYSSNLPTAAYLASWLANNDNIALVAQADGMLVGGIVAYTLHKFEQERTEVYIYDLAVARNQQRKGIGKQLVARLCRTAKEQGASTVFVQADEGDDAIKFYESLSPVENARTRTFDLRLDG